MSIITLTTDFGIKDHFVGAVKGSIYSELPDAKIVDISHQISPFNIMQTAYIVRNAYKTFPKGTVHIIGVDAELSKHNKHIALYLDGHYFICADNGVISLLAGEIQPEKIVEITIQNHYFLPFTLENFVKVACHLVRGGTLDVVGRRIENIKKLSEFKPVVTDDGNTIKGSIIYIDNYGNSISNISKKLFKEVGKGRSFEIDTRGHIFKKLYEKYSDIITFSEETNSYINKDGEALALFNSSDFLEFAMYRSNLETVGGA
ncbi:MAG: SAM-dependent chlorinase/fluorinase, partial [Flavobacteriaceae bacterium]|nr:SAM-dependent chlorinase/fluorinase [Flavobacteriaceae bacterium]